MKNNYVLIAELVNKSFEALKNSAVGEEWGPWAKRGRKGSLVEMVEML